jgi:hypothetical protein
MKLRLTLTPTEVAHLLDTMPIQQKGRVFDPVEFSRAKLKRDLMRSIESEADSDNETST